MKKIWAFLFTTIISMNQLYAMGCQVNCELMEKVTAKSQDHNCCPQSEDKEADASCPGHELFGKCFHEKIGFNLDKEIVKSSKKIESTFIISSTILQTSIFSVVLRENNNSYKYQYFKSSRPIYILQEKFLV